MIAPWGFELFGDRAFLAKNIRRYYCYFGIKDKKQHSLFELQTHILNIILDNLPDFDEKFSRQIIALLRGEKVSLLKANDYSVQPDDKALIVLVKESDDILTDYAKYIIGSVWSVTDGVGDTSQYQSLHSSNKCNRPGPDN